MTHGKHCECKWDGDTVVSECGAHFEFFKKQMQPLIQTKAKLEQIQAYSKSQHPLISSQACPLCEWNWEYDDETGFGKGKRIKECGYHHALNQLYTIKIEGNDED